jgi:hypothetical protein
MVKHPQLKDLINDKNYENWLTKVPQLTAKKQKNNMTKKLCRILLK